jgi:hypothetical protein
VPLIGECWIGLFARDAHRDGHLGWRQVSPDGPEIAFPVLQSKRFEVRLYRWTPAGETLEASLDVGPSPSSEEVASA